MELHFKLLENFDPHTELVKALAALNTFSLSLDNGHSVAPMEDNLWTISLIQEKVEEVINYLEDERVHIDVKSKDLES